MNGGGANGLYCFTVGRRCDRLAQRLADFIAYASSHERTVILASPEDIAVEEMIDGARAQTPPANVVREEDPRRLVHSTTLDRWARIQACGQLRCAARLRGEGDALPSVGSRDLGDPPDFEEYVMLGKIDSIGPEYVVASQQAGHLLPEPESVYEPGVRLYFDGHAIIHASLAVRDGMHETKVRGRLALDPYLVCAIRAEDVDPAGEVAQWTTSRFLAAANERFGEAVG